VEGTIKGQSSGDAPPSYLTVNWEFDRSDYLAILEERQRLAPKFLSRLYYFGIMPCLCVALAVAADSLPVAAIFTVLYLGAGWVIERRIRSLSNRIAYNDDFSKLWAGRFQATVADEGLNVSSDASNTLIRWPFVAEVFHDSKCVHFVLTRFRHAHIPVRAFGGDQHLERFIVAANSHIKKCAH